ncbi:MAG: type II CRISPR-associated endonuclease Cas1 [Pelagibacterales bacterium]|nr:type II CRISPR-associated endonuclease Cas1 [Pelagibacterales bacterium]
MTNRIIEISDPLVSLSMSRGFLIVKIENTEKTRIAFEDIGILVLNGTGATITTNLLNALLEAGTMIVVLGANYLPSGIFYPTNPHYLHKQKINLQIQSSKPLEKRLWQQVVKAKILNQAAILSHFSGEDERQLLELAKKVSSGDKENLEAQAARKYWQKLFGENFRRNFESNGINSMLNYGYAILRSATARAIFASGLHPAIGIHHSNQENAFCLVDDLMEPFRPMVDFVVKKISEENQEIQKLTPAIKKNLTKILNLDLSTQAGTTPINNCLTRLCQSFVRSLENREANLDFPLSPLPNELIID